MRQFLVAAAALALLATPTASFAATEQAFKPGGQTVLVSATTTAATVTLNGSGGSLLIVSACTVPVRVETSGQPATTPTTSVPGSLGLGASSTSLLEVGTFLSTVSVKVDSGSACNVELTRGEGMAH